MDLWLRMLEYAGTMPEEQSQKYRAMFGRDVAVHGPAEVEAIITGAGFTDLASCYQAVLIRGWTARRA